MNLLSHTQACDKECDHFGNGHLGLKIIIHSVLLTDAPPFDLGHQSCAFPSFCRISPTAKWLYFETLILFLLKVSKVFQSCPPSSSHNLNHKSRTAYIKSCVSASSSQLSPRFLLLHKVLRSRRDSAIAYTSMVKIFHISIYDSAAPMGHLSKPKYSHEGGTLTEPAFSLTGFRTCELLSGGVHSWHEVKECWSSDGGEADDEIKDAGKCIAIIYKLRHAPRMTLRIKREYSPEFRAICAQYDLW